MSHNIVPPKAFHIPSESDVANLRLGSAISPQQNLPIRRNPPPSSIPPAPNGGTNMQAHPNVTDNAKRKRDDDPEENNAGAPSSLRAVLARMNESAQAQRKSFATQRAAAPEPIRLSNVRIRNNDSSDVSVLSNSAMPFPARGGASVSLAKSASANTSAQRSAPVLPARATTFPVAVAKVPPLTPPALPTSTSVLAPKSSLASLSPLFRANSNDLKYVPSKAAAAAAVEPTPQQRFEARMAKQQSLAIQSSKNKSAKITRNDPKTSYQKESEQEEKKRRRLASKAERDATQSELSRTIPADQLSPDQRRVIEAVLAGRNVFFTGSAGTGKSTLLRHLISILPPSGTYVTASTGMAAINIGGITLHQYAGIGLGEGTKVELAAKVAKGKAVQWWRTTKVLIIDEISMIDKDLFEKIEYVARIVRQNMKPFGGLQLICCGDFFQLPPVSKGSKETFFCFESPEWPKCIQENIELTRVFRQADPKFVGLLNEIRHGQVTAETLRVLDQCKTHHLQLGGAEHLFIAHDEGPENFKEALKNNAPAPTHLRLKVGAQVLLIKNLAAELGLANGARGIVVGFDESKKSLPIVRFINGVERTLEQEKWPIEIAGVEVAFRCQIPVKLGWALSIHKSQGLTLNFAEMSLDQVFEYGQAYVALSRVSSLAGLKLLSFKASAVKAHPKVIAFYRSFDNFNAS